MIIRSVLFGLLCLLEGCADQQFVTNYMSSAESEIPEPESWSFPDIVESARKISPNNLEGRPFNKFGLAYPMGVLSNLDVSSMRAKELQNYADVVTHAYPDAVSRQLPRSCDEVPINQLNETSVAGIAFVSLNAINEETRKWAKECLIIIQKKWK
ncbi:hypothetical protein [Microbulbifer aestuariivivens]|uniref:hypothetical protein n=1 Tax=Microbulbifer aestuariivivens TaxID=1908308 RepID=UPI0031ED01BC